MKLARLSLAAIVVAGLGTTGFAASDTLADAFKNGKVSGEIKAYYFDREGSANVSTASTKQINSDIFTTGIMLHYDTDTFYGFNLGATFQGSASPFADGDVNTAGTAKSDFKSDIYGSGTQLSEAYVNYAYGKSFIKAGRQYLVSPLVNGSGSRIVKQSFDAVIAGNMDIPDTVVMIGVGLKYQPRTTGSLNVDANADGDIGEFINVKSAYGDYVYTAYAMNKSITNTTITAQYAGIPDQVHFYYAEAAYVGKINDFTYGLTANYELKAPEIGENGTMYGAKASLGYGAFNTYVAYTTITEDADIAGLDGGGAFGGGAQTALAKGYQNRTGTYKYSDTDAYSVDVNYNFKDIGLLVGARYTGVSVGDNANTYAVENLFKIGNLSNQIAASERGKDFVYTDIYAVYDFTGALKGLSTDVSYQDWSEDADGHDFWFKANYKF